MGQKINPISLRMGINKYWQSTWFEKKNYSLLLMEDSSIRSFIEKNYSTAGIKKPEIDAALLADSIAKQLEKRIAFRKAMKRSGQSATKMGAKGVKIVCAGRLGGAEIARTEKFSDGSVPLHTLRADIDYATARATTTYGIIGIKVWLFKGEIKTTTKEQNKEKKD